MPFKQVATVFAIQLLINLPVLPEMKLKIPAPGVNLFVSGQLFIQSLLFYRENSK